ncbi:HNH endonuclease signature motif containing protein, partial [Mycolicibacterium vaccae]
SQVHHVVADWANGGNTNVDELGLACGPHNRSVDENGGWTTRMNQRCEVEWDPPPQLDREQARLNNYHRPERLLRPPEEPEPENPAPGSQVRDAEPDAPRPTGDPDQPGGPAPPDGRAA